MPPSSAWLLHVRMLLQIVVSPESVHCARICLQGMYGNMVLLVRLYVESDQLCRRAIHVTHCADMRVVSHHTHGSNILS